MQNIPYQRDPGELMRLSRPHQGIPGKKNAGPHDPPS